MSRSTIIASKQAVFAGIDFHKQFSVITLGDIDGQVIEQLRLTNDEHQIRKFFLRRSNLKCAIENCRGNEWFVDLLKDIGCQVFVGNTAAIRLIADSRCKTDKIDSRILMELLAKNFLPVCYQASKQERILREQLRWRVALVRSRTQYKNRVHALIDKENKGQNITSKRSRSKLLEQMPVSSQRQGLLTKHIEVIDYFEGLVKEQDKCVEILAKDSEDAVRLQTIPGIGDKSALMFLAEIGDYTRFKKARQVSSYFGLVPRVYSSANTRYLGSITKKGSRMMRWLLIQDAWKAVSDCKPIRSKYVNICIRRGKKVAIVAIARMLAEIAFRILRDKTEFNEKLLALG